MVLKGEVHTRFHVSQSGTLLKEKTHFENFGEKMT